MMNLKAIFFWIISLQLVRTEEIFGNMKQDFFACDRVKNVTIVPFMKQNIRSTIFSFRVPQLTYLIKSLLDTPCTTVWVYSPLENRSIAQNKDNSNIFLETKIQAMDLPDTNVLIDFLNEVKKLAVEENQHTLLFIALNFQYDLSEQEISLIVDCLKESMEYMSVVMQCSNENDICSQSEKFIPLPKIIYDVRSKVFNPHVHKVLLDGIIDKDYDRFKEYDDLDCRNKSRRLHLLFTPMLGRMGSEPNMVKFFQFKFKVRVDFFWQLQLFLFFGTDDGLMADDGFIDLNEAKAILMKANGDDIINIIIKLKGESFPIPEELKPLSKWVIVIVDNSIHDSPRIEKDGTITIWEEDIASPLLFHMLIKKFKELIC
eukprot:TCONS_00073285-protein